MPEGIVTPEGRKLDLDPAEVEEIERDFARSMSEPTGEDKAPPKRATRTAKPVDDGDKPRVRRGPRKPPEPTTATSRPKPTGLSHEVRKQGVQGVVQLSAAGCLLAERVTGQKAFRADAITLASSAEDLGSAIADTCDQDERFARVVDRICSAGPYAALIQVTFQVGMQLARNHGVPVPGTDPDELIAMAEAPVPAAA